MSRHVTNGIHNNGFVDSALTPLLMMLLLHFVKQRDNNGPVVLLSENDCLVIVVSLHRLA
jgi:hypothetical protein